ncbi:MAG: GFA family protein [Fuscovulum sp.]|nr:GFA family protein [Fuscovulum sp.]
MSAMKGHCLCGAVTLDVTAHCGFTAVCHCRMCQRWTGGLFICVPADFAAVTVAGPVVVYRSSDVAERAFCGTCGSHLWYRTHEGDGHYGLMPGLFDAALALPLKSEIYTDRALSGLALPGSHPRATRAEYEAKNAHLEGDLP